MKFINTIGSVATPVLKRVYSKTVAYSYSLGFPYWLPLQKHYCGCIIVNI